MTVTTQPVLPGMRVPVFTPGMLVDITAGSVPAGAGRLARWLSAGPVTARVQLCGDGTIHRIPHAAVTPTAAAVRAVDDWLHGGPPPDQAGRVDGPVRTPCRRPAAACVCDVPPDHHLGGSTVITGTCVRTWAVEGEPHRNGGNW